mgnify:CR=1 FL=1
MSLNDEIIMPTFSFFATAGTVARLGAKPVLADVDFNSYNISVNEIEKLITPNTKAIMPVHLFGQSAEMDVIMNIASKYNLFVVEDCAQSIGANYNCLLYTSDAADERSSVDLGGRRIIKKKTQR